MPDVSTIEEYVRAHDIRVDMCVAYGLTRDSDGWEHYRYTVRLAYGDTGRTVTTAYRMGIAHTRNPSASEVFEAITDDACSGESYSDAWEMAEEFGTEVRGREDYERMLAMYDACRAMAEILPVFVGGQTEWEAVRYLERS